MYLRWRAGTLVRWYAGRHGRPGRRYLTFPHTAECRRGYLLYLIYAFSPSLPPVLSSFASPVTSLHRANDDNHMRTAIHAPKTPRLLHQYSYSWSLDHKSPSPVPHPAVTLY